MIRLVVFDCDGTLVDSQHLITATMVETFAAYGLPAPTLAAVRGVVGLNLEEAIARLLPEGMRGEAFSVADRYRTIYHRLKIDPSIPQDELFDGARETLEKLNAASYLLGVATGKSRRGLASTLERHGLERLFVTLQTADDAPSKPDPTMMRRAMGEAGVNPRETVMIGDSVFDIMMAANAGTRALGVSWGYHDPRELQIAGASGLVARFSEIPALVRAMSEEKEGADHGR